MRALPIVSALVLSLSALAACSAQPEGSPPHSSGAGATSSGAGASAGGATGTAGANTGFGGATGTAGANTGFGGANTGFGGATGTAGSTGTAGGTSTTAGCAMTKAGAGLMGLIDDFETHAATPTIPATDNRAGQWWISVGPTGTVATPTLAMPKGGAPLPVTGGMGGGMALHFAGTDTDKTMGWGADASVALAATGDCYDASAYTTGIKISLMSAKSSSVYVQVITAQDKAASATSGNQRVEIPITSTWTDYPIAWSELVTGWGAPIVLDPKSIVALDIAPSAASAFDFDIWIDNVQFVK